MISFLRNYLTINSGQQPVFATNIPNSCHCGSKSLKIKRVNSNPKNKSKDKFFKVKTSSSKAEEAQGELKQSQSSIVRVFKALGLFGNILS